ncbi:glycosyltransferase family 39 protein [Actinokineospora sp.]|uniref:glycosyltransferase family 39 protein n=1 Tax=Actinokineospora sp. TaxID=1872133 RepID=UPI0040378DFD
MTQHRWSADSSARLSLRLWRTLADERIRAADRDLIALAAPISLAALAAAVRLAGGAGPSQTAEARHVAQVFSIDQLGTLLNPVETAAAPLAWLQLGGYTAVTDAFTRHTSALSAVREPLALAAALGTLLLWLLARRMGLSRWTAAAAAGIVALSPLAVGVQVAVRPENVAVPWVLAALVLLWTPRRHRRLAPDLWATAFLVVAVITAPVTLVLAVTAAWLIWRRGRKRLSLMLGSLFTLGIGIGLGASAALSGIRLAADGPAPAQWLSLDPVLAAAGVFAAVGALFSFRLRPLAFGVLALIAITTLPGGPGAGALTVVVPLAALLVAGTVECGVTHRARAGKHTVTRPLLLPTAALALTVAASALPAWTGALTASAADVRAADAPGTAAARWLRDNLPTTPVLTDEATWVELIRAGRPPDAVTRSAACVDTCPARTWLLVTPGLRAELARRPALAEAAARAEAVAVFGDGPQAMVIHRPAIAGAAAGERRARALAGADLAGSPRIAADPAVADTLRAGRTDPRVLTTLSALASARPVRVAALPAVPGEDAADQPRRQVLLAAAGDPAEQLVLFFSGQRGVFRPESVAATPEGVLVRYPPGVPAGLLTPYDVP